MGTVPKDFKVKFSRSGDFVYLLVPIICAYFAFNIAEFVITLLVTAAIYFAMPHPDKIPDTKSLLLSTTYESPMMFIVPGLMTLLLRTTSLQTLSNTLLALAVVYYLSFLTIIIKREKLWILDILETVLFIPIVIYVLFVIGAIWLCVQYVLTHI